MQFADTVIDQLWEVWRISQVDKCEKVRTGDSGMGAGAPAYTHFIWMWTMASASSKANIGGALVSMLTHPKSWIIDKVRKLILCLFTQHQEAVRLNWPSLFHGKHLSNMTWHLFVNIFHFLFYVMIAACAFNQDTRFFFFNKVEQSVRKGMFCSFLIKNNLWSWKASVCFREAATKKRNKTNPQQKGTSIQFKQMVHLK